LIASGVKNNKGMAYNSYLLSRNGLKKAPLEKGAEYAHEK
jgi:hypothetical protein